MPKITYGTYENYHSNQSAVESVCHSVFSQVSPSVLAGGFFRLCPLVSCPLSFIILCLNFERNYSESQAVVAASGLLKRRGIRDM